MRNVTRPEPPSSDLAGPRRAYSRTATQSMSLELGAVSCRLPSPEAAAASSRGRPPPCSARPSAGSPAWPRDPVTLFLSGRDYGSLPCLFFFVSGVDMDPFHVPDKLPHEGSMACPALRRQPRGREHCRLWRPPRRCRRSSTCCVMLKATVSSTSAIVTVRYSDGLRYTHSDVGLRYFIAKAHKIFHGTEVTPLLPRARSLYICNERTRICICSRLSARSYCHSGGVGARLVSNRTSDNRQQYCHFFQKVTASNCSSPP